MAYSITFKSLRAGANDSPYVVNIGGTGGKALMGGVQPFVTQEDDDEDVFLPVRKQSGYLRVIDDGSFNWRALIPTDDMSTPVVLTKGGTVMWQGFMQAQTFSGELYGNPQEREYPVQCALSALASQQAPTNQTDMSNFAALIYYILVTRLENTGVEFNNFIFQGGYDAVEWLIKKFDWHNFIDVNDNGVTPKYTLLELLEETCRFWGWTCRTWRDCVIFTCADDSAEPKALELTKTTLGQLANGYSVGYTHNDMFAPLSISDSFQNPAFASTNNEDTILRGISKATVTANCNETKELIEFAPQIVREQMEAHGYSWTQPDPDINLIGLFYTPDIAAFNSQYISGSGHFDRRQIYSEEKANDPAICDCVLINGWNTGSARATIHTNHDRIFAGGSLKMSGTLYDGVNVLTSQSIQRGFKMRVGIGSDINNAQWFNANININPVTFTYGWSGNYANTFHVFPDMNIGAAYEDSDSVAAGKFPSIPIADGNGNPISLQGKVFVEFLGSDEDGTSIGQNFQVANFKLEYSRDVTAILGMRARVLIKERKNSRDYIATSNNPCNDEWKADCIFASDNYMEYGYGLLMNTDGSFMTTAPYGNSSAQPEQHLANRVASYWNGTKHRIDAELQSQALASGTAINDINPRHKVTIGGVTGDPVAISHDWRDDVVTLTVIEDTANV